MVSAKDSLRAELETLLAESEQSVKERERHTFDRAVAPYGERLVIAGAGGLGRKTAAALRSAGIEPLAFTDNNPKLWGTRVQDLEVLQPAVAAQRYGHDSAFCVTIWGGEGTDTMPQRMRALRELGCVKVVDFGALFWKFAATLLPHYSLDVPHKVLAAAPAIRAAFELWQDEASLREFVAHIRWRLWLDFENLPPPVKEEIYYPASLASFRPDEVFVDCGAFDGDTVRDFLRHAREKFKHVFAFEADHSNYQKLNQFVAGLAPEVSARITASDHALSDHEGVLYFSNTGGPGAAVAKQGTEVNCTRLDVALNEAPTWIKMDIEGSEPAALRGAEMSITRHAPLLSICVYHSQDHVWSIPNQIAKLRPDYRFYLRPYVAESWDLVCYAIPPQRVVARAA
jgi:FkbM family methyltransferase